jgi:hypothetical protein
MSAYLIFTCERTLYAKELEIYWEDTSHIHRP